MSCDYVKWIMQVGLIVFFSLNYDDKYQHKAKLNSDIISRSSWVQGVVYIQAGEVREASPLMPHLYPD